MTNVINIFLLTCLWASAVSCSAQRVTSGVYMTFEDYLNGEMEYAINCSEESHKIRPNGTWKGDKIIVIHRGQKFVHDRSEIFGYRNCKGKDWRIYGTDDYLIVEAKSIIIYKLYEEESMDPDDGPIPPTYHFSVDDGNLKELTLMNLKKAFPEEHDFHDNLDETFSGGIGITSYDEFHKIYKINRVLAITGN